MLTLICGQPRAGKTTYSEQFENVVHLDSCGYKGVQRHVMRTEGDIVVEGVYRHVGERKRLVDSYRGETRCIWLDTPDDVRRTREGWSKLCDKPFEPPTYQEGWDEIIILRGGGE